MITIVQPDDRRLVAPDPAKAPPGASPEQLRSSRMQLVNPGEPYVHLASHEPGWVVEPHSHPHAEVMVVLEGSLDVGGTYCAAGTVVVIPAGETYGLDVGADGVTYLVTRPGQPERR